MVGHGVADQGNTEWHNAAARGAGKGACERDQFKARRDADQRVGKRAQRHCDRHHA